MSAQPHHDLEHDLEGWISRFARRERTLLPHELSCTLGRYGRPASWVRNYVAISTSIQNAMTGQPEIVTIMTVPDCWHQNLHRYCQILEIPFQEPGWLLAATMDD
ncbi:hypothetical protein [Acaryochloris marina]|uniref:hypothetical protein n=1 Tax=Acaryochloris marina TaxID=155978 RepID=UPI0021C4252E|nr:hypothetical protein [Acaryochloris marina]